MKHIVILGSTGSIGTNTLDIIEKCPDQFRVVGLTARTSHQKLEQQIRQFHPDVVALEDESSVAELRGRCKDLSVEILAGTQGIETVAKISSADLVISSIVGGAGLLPTLSAIRAGKHVALANKEPMVMAGQLMQQEAERHGVKIFPVDSEHSAIFQSLEGHRREDVLRLILTASGGPLWNMSKDEIDAVNPERALQHPNWKMGAKITIDSATMMNKGLEVIEARWLFDIEASQIDVLVHRESIVHSLVEYKDRSVIAQLGLPDMRTPISYAMQYPGRIPLDLPSLNLVDIGTLTFFPPDHTRFPCLKMGYDALQTGGTMPAVLNAANEVAVAAFLQDGIRFSEIAEIIHTTMEAHSTRPLQSIESALDADAWAREKADALVHSLAQ